MLLQTAQLREYECVYTHGIYYLIARTDEDAAYNAAELAPYGEKLLNVTRTHEW